MKEAFNNRKYISVQKKTITQKISSYDKLYLECGGKLLDDYHASRCLPGFKIESKLDVLKSFKKNMEVIICISAQAIEKNKLRSEYGITYDSEVLRLIDTFRELEISVNSVVITLYNSQVQALNFKNKLERFGIKTYIHTFTKGYPTDIDVIVSDEGYGANEYIETTKPLVVVTAPGPGSGKLATCLSQLYHENKRNIKAGYAKYETFPVWDLPLKHPLNIAYEAATADLKDVNMIDPFHLEAYGKTAINYNRDIETFPIVKNILEKIMGYSVYSSPTDMGVNMISSGIVNDEEVQKACKKEICRRYFESLCDYKMGLGQEDTANRIKMLMNELSIDDEYNELVKVSRQKNKKTSCACIAIRLPNGKIVTGKQTELLTPVASAFLNSIKSFTRIPDKIDLLSPAVINPILKYKINNNKKTCILNANEVLIALAVSSVTNPTAQKALSNLNKLENCEAHSTYIIRKDDMSFLKSLKIRLSSDPVFITNDLFN